MPGLKFADEGIVEGLGVPFGAPDRKDAHGEYFDQTTEFDLGWFGERPLLYHHGIGEAGPAVIGRVSVEPRPEGLWVRAVLDRAGKFFERVKTLLQDGRLGFSSGSLGHLVRTRPDGHIDYWPLVEMSLTPTPASRDAAVYSVKADAAFDHFRAAGLATAGLKSFLEDDATDLASIRDQFIVRTEKQKFDEMLVADLRTERTLFYAQWGR
ncbi:MAG: hypothetical protein M3Q66_02410 [Chloroflexota bacterium]|nr:hypothetical protein [Chloroflexota bacterium]